MDQQEIENICKKLLSSDQEIVTSTARSVVNTTPDRELRNDLTVLVTKYQTAKDSVESMNAFEELVTYVKNEFASIYAQGFHLGSSYQMNLIERALIEAQKANSEKQGSDTDCSN